MNDRETTLAENGIGRCSHCGRPLPGGKWFAWLRRNERVLEFCRPQCVDAFLRVREQETMPSGMAYDDAD